MEVDGDGERVVMTAREQLVLRCVQASITGTKSGKVLVRGAYLLSRLQHGCRPCDGYGAQWPGIAAYCGRGHVLHSDQRGRAPVLRAGAPGWRTPSRVSSGSRPVYEAKRGTAASHGKLGDFILFCATADCYVGNKQYDAL